MKASGQLPVLLECVKTIAKVESATFANTEGALYNFQQLQDVVLLAKVTLKQIGEE